MAFAAGAGGINLYQNPKAILNSTNTWTAAQTFSSITVIGACGGCSSGGGASDNFGSHIPTTTIQGRGQAVIGSSQVIIGDTTGYGSLSISSLAAPASWSFYNASTGGPGYLYDEEAASYTVRVQTMSFLGKCLTSGTSIQGDVNDSYLMRVGDFLRNPAALNGQGTRKYVFTHNGPITRMVLKNQSGEMEWGETSLAASFFGSLDNNAVHFRVNDNAVGIFDTNGSFGIGNSAFPNAKLTIGDPSSGNTGNGSKFQVQAGSITTSGLNSGYALNGKNVFDSSFTWTGGQFFSSMSINGSGGAKYSLTVTTPGVSDYHVAITTWAHMSFSGSSPTISNCGTSPSGACIACTDMAGTIQIGGTAPTACTVTFQIPFLTLPGNPTCTVSDNSATVGASVATLTNKALTIGFPVGGLAGGLAYYRCDGIRE